MGSVRIGRPPKAPGEKQDKDIRVKVKRADKTEFEQAALDDGIPEVSVWLKTLARRRVGQLALRRRMIEGGFVDEAAALDLPPKLKDQALGELDSVPPKK